MKRDSSICPKCGSRNIHAGKRGFKTGRAVAGGLLTGNLLVSAAAGGVGSNKIVLTCLDCGCEFGIGEGGIEPPKENEFTRIEKKYIPEEERQTTNMYRCECGKEFCGEGSHPKCPKCGRRLDANHIILPSDVDKMAKSGCLGFMLIPIVLLSSLFFIF